MTQLIKLQLTPLETAFGRQTGLELQPAQAMHAFTPPELLVMGRCRSWGDPRAWDYFLTLTTYRNTHRDQISREAGTFTTHPAIKALKLDHRLLLPGMGPDEDDEGLDQWLIALPSGYRACRRIMTRIDPNA